MCVLQEAKPFVKQRVTSCSYPSCHIKGPLPLEVHWLLENRCQKSPPFLTSPVKKFSSLREAKWSFGRNDVLQAVRCGTAGGLQKKRGRPWAEPQNFPIKPDFFSKAPINPQQTPSRGRTLAIERSQLFYPSFCCQRKFLCAFCRRNGGSIGRGLGNIIQPDSALAQSRSIPFPNGIPPNTHTHTLEH